MGRPCMAHLGPQSQLWLAREQGGIKCAALLLGAIVLIGMKYEL